MCIRDRYEDDNVGTQALSEGEKAAGSVRDISKSRYAKKLKKKAKMQGKKGTKTAKSSAQEPTAAQDTGASGTGKGGSNWLSRWKQRQEIHKSYYAAARSGTCLLYTSSIRNCLTVFQRDPLLSGAIAYNILTDRKDIIKPIGFHRESTALNDTDMKYRCV